MLVKKILTIAIPTIDEEKGLNRLLKSIYENLKEINEYEFLVSISIGINGGKNPIPYVKGILNKLKRLKIIKAINYEYRPININFSSNLTYLHSKSEEGFIWFIGDDDIVLEGSINYIINELKKITSKNYESSNIPPIYLNWISDEKIVSNYSKPLYKTVDEFCKYEHSIFFLSAMIVYKQKNSYMHGIEHFSHLWIFLTQALSAKKVLLFSKPMVKYTAVCRYKKDWIDIMFYNLPFTLISLKNLGLPQKSIKSIIKTSLENRTIIYTTLFLANKKTLSEKLFSIACVIKYSDFFTTKFKFLIITAILISPLYKPLKWIKRTFLNRYL